MVGIVFCGIKLYMISSDYKESRQIYADLNEQYLEQPKEEVTFQMAEQELDISEEVNVPFEVDFESLAVVNRDIVGWIYIPNTIVNYPIVKSKDNVDYLNRAADGSYAVAGAIFMDCNNQPDFSDQNTIIYGHNMKDGSMFHCLSSFGKQEFLNEHNEIWIFTPASTMKFRVVAAYQTTFDSNTYFTMFSGKSYSEYLDSCVQRSTIQTPILPDSGSSIITLSTCMKHGTPNRFVVILQCESIYDEVQDET